MTYLAASVQFEPALARPEVNVPRILSLTEEAAQHGARLIVLPEMANIGYCFRSRDEVAPYLETVPGPLTGSLEEIATRHNCVIVCGLGEIDRGRGLYYNTAVVVGPTGYLGKYRKTHFFSADAKWAVEGDEGFPVWDTPVGRLGIEVCMDATYPETGRLLALQGAEVICFPTNWVGSVTPDHRWISQAFENGVYWIAANRCGEERGLEFQGGSSIIGPDGTVLALAPPGDGMVYAEIDLDRARARRFDDDHLEHKLEDRHPQLYQEMLQSAYTWSANFYHSLYGAPGLPEPRTSRIAVVQWEERALHPTTTLHALRLLLPTELLDLIVLPELLLAGHEPVDGASENGLINLHPLLELAAERRCLVAGTVIERDHERLFHTVVLVDETGILGTHRKCHLTHDETQWATAGAGPFRTFDTPVGRIGLIAGYDACFFETLRVLATQGADVVAVPSSIPWTLQRNVPDSKRTWNFWQTKAWESCTAMAVANYTGAGRTGATGIWIPDVREDRSRAAVADTNSNEVVVETVDTRSRYLREKRGLGWRRLHWYTPLVERSGFDGDDEPSQGVRSVPVARKSSQKIDPV